MNDPVTARDVMNRSYVGVNEGDSVAGAARLMRDEGVDGAVVLRGSDPVGIFSATDVVDLVAEGADPGDTTVGDVMMNRVLSVELDQRLSEVASSLADNDIRHVLVMDNDDIAGVLSEHDIVTAQTMKPIGANETEPVPPEVEAELDPDEVTNQGVCEICGSLSQDLTEVNGQMVCAACREV